MTWESLIAFASAMLGVGAIYGKLHQGFKGVYERQDVTNGRLNQHDQMFREHDHRFADQGERIARVEAQID